MPFHFVAALSLMASSLLALASPAAAHPGNHAGMALIEFVQHYAEPDHLAFLALTIVVGVAAYRHGRRVEAKAHVAARHQAPARHEGDRS